VDAVCDIPQGSFGSNATPLKLSDEARGQANATYDQYALSITAFESSPDVSAFSWQFDAALATPNQPVLTPNQLAGWDLFRGKAKCNTCHLDGSRNNFQQYSTGSSTTGAGNTASVAPLFTDFTSSNLGLPRNPQNPYYCSALPTVRRRARIQPIPGTRVCESYKGHPWIGLVTARPSLLFITWTTNTNGSSSVHYGNRSTNLDQMAASPHRWSRNLPNMVHRVLLLNLKPSTTYYYVVDSNGVKSTVSRFETHAKQ
jgi:Purple acid Phosphatase, N-terminal domain